MGSERDLIIEKIRRFLKDEDLKMAILFGSYARGTESKDSDVDILLIDQKFEQLDTIERARISWGLVKNDFEWSADIICLTPEEYQREIDMQMAAKDASEEGILIEP